MSVIFLVEKRVEMDMEFDYSGIGTPRLVEYLEEFFSRKRDDWCDQESGRNGNICGIRILSVQNNFEKR
jgi:hypothetical protein